MADLPPGTQLAGYRIATVLGRGGMGVVYLAQQLALERPVALKVINPELSDDAEFRERFSREAQLAAAVDHRQIIPVYDAGEADGRLYLSMRYVKGFDLRTVLQLEGPLAPGRALGVLGAVAEALDAAHAIGLVHRDVKPANVLIEDGPGPEPERVFLTDFGLTKRVDAASGLTRTGIFIGTPDYASPEQCSGKPVDGRTDVYSLACVLHECLSGITPFPRDSDAQVLAAQLLEPPPPLSSVRPGLPDALDHVLARGLAKDPAARFATCGEMIEAARAALSGTPGSPGETVVAPPPPPGGFAAAEAGVAPDAPTAPRPAVTEPATIVGHRRGDDHPRRRSTWLFAAVAAVVLVAGVVVMILALSGGPEPKGGPTTRASGPSTGASSGPASSAPATAELAAYAKGVDDLLAESARFRQRLVDAVVEAGNVNRKRQEQDLATVRDVIAERRSALQRVGTWAVPTEAGVANDLLAQSFRDAIVDDRDYEQLVLAYIAHDDGAAKRVLDELQAHRDAATDPDKDAFLRSYNALRQRAGLPPLPQDTRF